MLQRCSVISYYFTFYVQFKIILRWIFGDFTTPLQNIIEHAHKKTTRAAASSTFPLFDTELEICCIAMLWVDGGDAMRRMKTRKKQEGRKHENTLENGERAAAAHAFMSKNFLPFSLANAWKKQKYLFAFTLYFINCWRLLYCVILHTQSPTGLYPKGAIGGALVHF